MFVSVKETKNWSWISESRTTGAADTRVTPGSQHYVGGQKQSEDHDMLYLGPTFSGKYAAKSQK